MGRLKQTREAGRAAAVVAACLISGCLSSTPVYVATPVPEVSTPGDSGKMGKASAIRPPPASAAAGSASGGASAGSHPKAAAKPRPAAIVAIPETGPEPGPVERVLVSATVPFRALAAHAEARAADAALARSGLAQASATHSIPQIMVKDHSTPVDLLIDPSKTPAQLKQELEAMLLSRAHQAARARGVQLSAESMPNTEVVSERVLIGRKMTAEIIASASDFEVAPSGPQEYAYRPGVPMHWRWQVKPKKESSDGMPLTLKVTADPGSGPSVTVIDRTVIVRSGLSRWEEAMRDIEAFITWINLVVSGALLALVGFVRWLFGSGEEGDARWKKAAAILARKKDEVRRGWFGHA